MESLPWITVPRVFGLEQYVDMLGRLSELCSARQKFVLDFRETRKAYPDGMVPLIAVIKDASRRTDLELEVLLPELGNLRRIFDGVGWTEYLTMPAVDFQAVPRSTPQFTPIRPFGRPEIGPLHHSIMEVLVRQVGLAPFVAEAAHWALWEVMDNVLNHSKAGFGWVQASTFREHRHMNIVVADTGIGIRESMAQRYPELDERERIRRAVERGETRDPTKYQGNGLHGCRDIATQNGGEFRVVTGEWEFVQEGRTRGKGKTRRDPLRTYRPLPSAHQGTVVELMLRTDREVDLTEALGAGRVDSLLELSQFVGGEHTFDIACEADDLGTRVAGRQLQNKVLNLAQVQSGDPVVLDFSGVAMISSSFADEFVAKLARRVGRSAWETRFELRGMNPSVGTVVRIALWQRLGKS